ncbi:MAG TPA: hypothetical protein VG602_03780 [Actinomycetota bacterium]|nr:hypothetical protein [Actinomycetota bacterium]
MNMRRRTARITLVAILTAVGLVEWAPPSQAAFHLMRIREVFGNHPAAPDAEFVELQMYAPLQSQVSGHHVLWFSTTGQIQQDCTIPGNVSSGAPQATILFATTSAQTIFGVVPDFTFPPAMSPSGGAVCFEGIDCVSWGSFTGSTPSATGTPFAGGLPALQSITRKVTGGANPAGLDEGDDTNDSNADFQVTSPTPQNNGGPGPSRACALSTADRHPTSKITKPRHGKTYGRIDRFTGTAAGVDLETVEIALRQSLSKGCAWWTGKRFVKGSCGKKVFVKASGTETWSYKLRKALPGSDSGAVRFYTLYSQVIDSAENEESGFKQGRNANRFEVS